MDNKRKFELNSARNDSKNHDGNLSERKEKGTLVILSYIFSIQLRYKNQKKLAKIVPAYNGNGTWSKGVILGRESWISTRRGHEKE